MKPFLNEEVYKRYSDLLETNWDGLAPIENEILAPMYGLKDRFAYYKAGNTIQRLDKIKVPTFALHALDDWVCME